MRGERGEGASAPEFVSVGICGSERVTESGLMFGIWQIWSLALVQETNPLTMEWGADLRT